MQLSIITAQVTPRLQYTCEFIFAQYFGIGYEIVTTAENSIADARLGYDKTGLPGVYHLSNCGLLGESEIRNFDPEVKSINNIPVLFPIESKDFGFDIFSAVFYLLSRYEEYQSFEPDMYGRYPHTRSIAFKNNFLDKPIISYWLSLFRNSLQNYFPQLSFRKREFSFTPTYDIDIAYSYKGKGFVRNLGGFIQSPSFTRLQVNLGLKKDPYDAYDFLDDLHSKYQLQPVYFFLLANKKGKFDKNLAPEHVSMQQLLEEHAQKYTVGIHPSWESYQNVDMVKEEIKVLQKHTSKPISKSRQHYIKLTLPESYRTLINAGITEDYSMGYGSTNGFRASVSDAFYWYDLQAEEATNLLIHPFCYMDANSFFEQKLGPEAAYKQLLHFYNECEKTRSPLVTIFHNDFLGTEKMFEGYREMYAEFIRDHGIPVS